MKNETHAQLALYKSGLKALGNEALDGRSDVEIRRAGAKRMTKHAAGAVLAAASVTGMGAELVWAVNHSPSVVYQDHLQQQGNVHNHGARMPQPTDVNIENKK